MSRKSPSFPVPTMSFTIPANEPNSPSSGAMGEGSHPKKPPHETEIRGIPRKIFVFNPQNPEFVPQNHSPLSPCDLPDDPTVATTSSNRPQSTTASVSSNHPNLTSTDCSSHQNDLSQDSSSHLLRSPTTILTTADNHNHLVGDDITHKDPNHLRIILQNPNGFSIENNLFEYEYSIQQMHSLCADVTLLPETNLFWPDYQVYTSTSAHRRHVHQHSKQVYSCSLKKYDSTYQPGGTCSIVSGHATGRVHSTSKDDPLGRWSIMHLNKSNGSMLSIICCYQVCNQTIDKVGPKTAFAQQWTILRDQGIEHPNPRRQFIKDLDKLLKSLTSQNHSIVLAGDFNESIGDDPNALDAIIIKYNLTDAVNHLHGSHEIPTYSRGTKRLDYIFLSHDLLPAISQSGILPFDSIIPSDHRPIFVDLDTRKCFGGEISPLMCPPSRRLLSKHKTSREDYVEDLFHSMERHNIFKRMEKLCKVKKSTTKSNDLAEAIDRDMTRLMLHSEKQFQKRSPTPFSSNLAQACLSVSILKLLQLSQKHGTDKKAAIASLQSKCTKKVPLPESLPATKSALKLARKEVKRIQKHAVEIRDQHLLDALSNCEDPKILKRIKRAEELSRSYQKIAHILNPSNAALVTQVEIPADGLPPKQAIKWNRITDPNQVTEIIFNRNTKHFQGAHGTPFTTEPLATVYDWSATTPADAATLEGSPPEHENELVQLILNHSKRKIRSFQATITLGELIKRLRKWSEKTSTSPSCRHLGHYKSLLPGGCCSRP